MKPSTENIAVSNAKDPPAAMLIPILLLASGIIILGIFNAVIVTQVLEPIALSL